MVSLSTSRASARLAPTAATKVPGRSAAPCRTGCVAVVAQTTTSASATAASRVGRKRNILRNAAARAARPANECFRPRTRARNDAHPFERQRGGKRNELIARDAAGAEQHQR